MTWVADIPRRFVREPTPAEYRELRRLRGTELPGLAVRARIVLLSAERVPIPEIMRRRRVSRPTVVGWLRRFEQSGLPGLSRAAATPGHRHERPALGPRGASPGLEPGAAQGISRQDRRRARDLAGVAPGGAAQSGAESQAGPHRAHPEGGHNHDPRRV